MITRNKNSKNLDSTIRRIASEVSLGHIKKEGKKQTREMVNGTLAFRNQRDTANPKSAIEVATKETAGQGSFLPISGGKVTGNFEVAGAVGFFNTTPASKPTISGSRGGNVALASLITGLVSLGLVTDGTSP